MTADWLTFQSFQRSQEVLQAINTLSTHLKLSLRGIPEEDLQAADRSADTLQSFLDKLEAAAEQAEGSTTTPIFGVDPRLQQLAEDYLDAKRERRFRSRLSMRARGTIKTLYASKDRDDQEALIEYLAQLRVLVEEHMRDDANQILGAI